VTNLLIVGAGNGGKTLLELFNSDPSINIIGVVDINTKAPGYIFAKMLKLPTSDNFNDFLKQPLDLIINVTGNSQVQENLSKLKSTKTEIIGGVSAKFIWDLIEVREQKNILEEKYKTVIAQSNNVSRDGLLIGSSPLMIQAADLASKVAATPSTVLITGETGTGKELIANNIHKTSHLKDQIYLSINCTAFSKYLIESELFGHIKGAFTGALQNKIGLFEKADGGTVFLDEIGDMPLDMQVKLLRFLQSGELRPIGTTENKHVKVRIIAATNRDLLQAVKQGRFREDLYYRLNTFIIHLPALRDRKEDIPLYTHHFLREAVNKVNKKVTIVLPEAINYLINYDWPGNLRELHGVMERAVILAANEQIEIEHLPFNIQNDPKAEFVMDTFSDAKAKVLADFEHKAIVSFLHQTNGNISLAAQKAGLPRRTFYRIMEKLNLSRTTFTQQGNDD
jgi:transcriptional regulator with PAS, ATPase and Fis domain